MLPSTSSPHLPIDCTVDACMVLLYSNISGGIEGTGYGLRGGDSPLSQSPPFLGDRGQLRRSSFSESVEC